MSARVLLIMFGKFPCKCRTPVKNLESPCDLLVNRGGVREGSENLARMSRDQSFVSTARSSLHLEHGRLRVEVTLRPFAFTVFRGRRRLLSAGELWAADCLAKDHFIPLTEAGLPSEELGPPRRVRQAEVDHADSRGAELALELEDGRPARFRIGLRDDHAVELALDVAEGP